MKNTVKTGFLTLLGTVGSLYASAASANDLNLLLVRESLSNVTDSGSTDLWQYEGGIVENATTGAAIGHYIANRRVTTSGTSADNTAGETITLFFPTATSGNAPNNLTLQGAYSYTSGQFAGSVSAVSTRYRVLNGLDAFAVVGSAAGTTKLTIDYVGIPSVP